MVAGFFAHNFLQLQRPVAVRAGIYSNNSSSHEPVDLYLLRPNLNNA